MYTQVTVSPTAYLFPSIEQAFEFVISPWLLELDGRLEEAELSCFDGALFGLSEPLFFEDSDFSDWESELFVFEEPLLFLPFEETALSVLPSETAFPFSSVSAVPSTIFVTTCVSCIIFVSSV